MSKTTKIKNGNGGGPSLVEVPPTARALPKVGEPGPNGFAFTGQTLTDAEKALYHQIVAQLSEIKIAHSNATREAMFVRQKAEEAEAKAHELVGKISEYEGRLGQLAGNLVSVHGLPDNGTMSYLIDEAGLIHERAKLGALPRQS